jgi:hypothetical protein
MGWSWALYFCHKVLSQCARRALHSPGLSSALVGDRQPPAAVHRGWATVAPYVDRFSAAAGAVLAALNSELLACGFVLHQGVAPTSWMDIVGKRFDGPRRWLRSRPCRTWRSWYASGSLRKPPVWSSPQMRRVLGLLVDRFQIRPELMPVLSACYVHVGNGHGPRRRFSMDVLRVLRACRGLAFLAFADLGRPVLPRIYCSDSSRGGFGLHGARSSAKEVLPLIQWKERWRFVADPATPAPKSRLDLLGVAAEYESELGPFRLWAEAQEENDMGTPVRPQPLPTTVAPNICEKVGMVEPLPDLVLDPSLFSCVVAWRWRAGVRHDIHNKEARGALLGLARESRNHHSYNSVLLSFGDNMSELLAFERGRARQWARPKRYDAPRRKALLLLCG